MKVETPKRVFEFNGQLLDDPNPNMTTEEVKVFYSDQFPEMLNSVVGSPEMASGSKLKYKIEGKVQKYGISSTPGTKG